MIQFTPDTGRAIILERPASELVKETLDRLAPAATARVVQRREELHRQGCVSTEAARFDSCNVLDRVQVVRRFAEEVEPGVGTKTAVVPT